MLKQMLDEMIDSQKLEKSDDSKRKSDPKLLVKAKLAEIKAFTDLMEGKLKRIGELSVKLVMMREDLEDTKEALGDNSKLLQDTDDTCAKKRKEYEHGSPKPCTLPPTTKGWVHGSPKPCTLEIVGMRTQMLDEMIDSQKVREE